MPIPKPSEGETQRDYMERCMSMMVGEGEDTDVAVAVCMKEWRNAQKSESSARKYTRFTAAITDLKVTQLAIDPATKTEFADKATVAKVLTGYATVFGKLSEDRGGYCYTVAPGAFAESLGRDDVRALFNHNPDYVLGRTTNGTLRLAEDARGLKVEIDMPDTQFARDLYTLIDRGDVTQMSFGGMVDEETRHDDGDMCIYSVRKFSLWDVSPVTYPAFEGTRIAVKAASALEASTAEAPKADENAEKAIEAARIADAMERRRRFNQRMEREALCGRGA